MGWNTDVTGRLARQLYLTDLHNTKLPSNAVRGSFAFTQPRIYKTLQLQPLLHFRWYVAAKGWVYLMSVLVLNHSKPSWHLATQSRGGAVWNMSESDDTVRKQDLKLSSILHQREFSMKFLYTFHERARCLQQGRTLWQEIFLILDVRNNSNQQCKLGTETCFTFLRDKQKQKLPKPRLFKVAHVISPRSHPHTV